MLEQALEKHRQGELAEAERLYRDMLAQEPENFELLHLLGVLKQEQGQLDDAQELVERALELRPNASAYFATLGSIRHNLGDIDGARANLEKALELNPNLPQGHNTLGYLMYLQGELEEAERTLEMALKLDPESHQAMTNLGTVLVAAGRPDEAIGHLQDALDRNDSTAARSVLGKAFLAQGAASIAEECFRSCLEQRPDALSLKGLLAEAVLASHRYGEARQLFQEVLAESAENPDALAGLATISQENRDFVEASKLLQRALIQRRGDPALLERLAACQIELGDVTSAGKILDALEGRTDPRRLLALRGRAKHAGGDRKGAIADLRHALEQDPADAESALLLAELLELAGDATAAHQVLEGVPEGAAGWFRVRLALASLDMAAGDAVAAEGRLDNMEIGVLPSREQAVIMEMWGRSLDAQQRHEGAATAFKKIAMAVPPRRLDLVRPCTAATVASDWPQTPPDDGRGEPIFLVGLPGSGVDALVEALKEMPDLEVLDDRISAPGERRDCLNQAHRRQRVSELDDTQITLARKDYWQSVERWRRKKAGRVLSLDWIPYFQFDPLQIARFFPSATILVVHRHPGDLLLQSASLGWTQGVDAGPDQLEAMAARLAEARKHTGLSLIGVPLDELAAGRAASLRTVFEPHAIAAQGLEQQLEESLTGTGQLVRFWPQGHWQHYRAHFDWEADRLESIAQSLAQSLAESVA